MRRATLVWLAVALTGVALAAAVSIAVDRLVTTKVGLSSEPFAATVRLAPRPARTGRRAPAHRRRPAVATAPSAPAPTGAAAAPARTSTAAATPPPASAPASRPPTVVPQPTPPTTVSADRQRAPASAPRSHDGGGGGPDD